MNEEKGFWYYFDNYFFKYFGRWILFLAAIFTFKLIMFDNYLNLPETGLGMLVGAAISCGSMYALLRTAKLLDLNYDDFKKIEDRLDKLEKEQEE